MSQNVFILRLLLFLWIYICFLRPTKHLYKFRMLCSVILLFVEENICINLETYFFSRDQKKKKIRCKNILLEWSYGQWVVFEEASAVWLIYIRDKTVLSIWCIFSFIWCFGIFFLLRFVWTLKCYFVRAELLCFVKVKFYL